MARKNELAVIPTADLLSEMEALEIVGGVGEICDVNVYVFGKCNPNDSSCNTYCSGANCIVYCTCKPNIEKPDPKPAHTECFDPTT
ncbi:MAG: hypothetical protein K2G11_09010 [Muribaculaceae bacterium]|nr:hypothetical protein [Muribaculaceae bacterium]